MNTTTAGEIRFHKVRTLSFLKCGDWNIRYTETADWTLLSIDCLVLCVCGDTIRISRVWLGTFDLLFTTLVNASERTFRVVDNLISIYSNTVCRWGRRAGRGDGALALEFTSCWTDLVWSDVRVLVHWAAAFSSFWTLG